ncbi:hypothetical protein DFH29DRAFT_174566 [Suillus ampliporus]|nr:hypothetical protein DFH29DRAFT_174566 [Suillus ampliporus]
MDKDTPPVPRPEVPDEPIEDHHDKLTIVGRVLYKPTRMTSRAWSTQSTGSSRNSSPDVDFLTIRRPSKATMKRLYQNRTPVRCFHAALRMDKYIFLQTKRKIRALMLRHLDVFVLYVNQPQARLEFLKREILLNAELSFLTQYEDGWAVDILIRHEFRKRDILERLARDAQVWNPYSADKVYRPTHLTVWPSSKGVD